MSAFLVGFVQVIGNGCPIYLRQCEARYWINKFDAKAKIQGRDRAIAWWKEQSEELKKKRGERGFASLVEYIKRERGKQ